MKKAVNGVRLREDVWGLPRWDDTLLWYAKAVREMRGRKLGDPTSWRYQAAIHGYDPTYPPLQQLARPDDKPAANQADVWNQCQHNSWYFLPWHRGYLGCFEAILRETIRGLGGPADDWALPYWNYSDSIAGGTHAKLVRPEFLEDKLPDGSDNMLCKAVVRAPYKKKAIPGHGDAGDFGLDAAKVSLAALDQHEFSSPYMVPTFGGSETGFNHRGGNAIGNVERTPHGDVHMAIGSVASSTDLFWMGSFNTAGLEPLFWLHHCNLDRLWQVWLARAASKGNPTAPKWLTPSNAVSTQRMPFLLHHPNKPNYSFTPKDVVDPAASVFAYGYDPSIVVARPRQRPAPQPPGPMLGFTVDRPMMEETMAEDRGPPELIGATRAPVALDGGHARATVAIEQSRQKMRPMSTRFELDAAAPVDEHVYLNLENVTADDAVVPYRVYLNVPEGFDPQRYADHLVGTMPMFGVREASRADAAHGGGGLSYVYDVTDVVKRVAPDGDLSHLEVAFAPDDGGAPAKGLKVGKISFTKR